MGLCPTLKQIEVNLEILSKMVKMTILYLMDNKWDCVQP